MWLLVPSPSSPHGEKEREREREGITRRPAKAHVLRREQEVLCITNKKESQYVWSNQCKGE
jgi:hypothetical protein